MEMTLINHNENNEKLPSVIKNDLIYLINNVTDWRARGADKKLRNYKAVAKEKGFKSEHNIRMICNKRLDLFKVYDKKENYRVGLELETSTIENGYNDLLKLMQLLKSNAIDYGVIIFIQNNRKEPIKLYKAQIENNTINAFKNILEEFNGRLFIYHCN